MNSVVKAIATVIVALATLLCFSMVLWNESNKRTADSQQQIRGALQCELSDKIATLLGNERRATYSRLTFERVPNAPWEAVIHFQNLQSWRDQSDELLARPRKISGDVVLDFQTPNNGSASGTGDLYGVGGEQQSGTAGFPEVWPESVAAPNRFSVTTTSLGSENLILAEQPPVVVETFPVSGARKVSPSETEIRVRFSKPMTDGSWRWCNAWEKSLPEFSGQPHYEADGKTCVLRVKLEAGRTYACWLSTEQFNNFTDRAGVPAVPYLLAFQTQTSSNH